MLKITYNKLLFSVIVLSFIFNNMYLILLSKKRLGIVYVMCYSLYNHLALWTSLPWLPPPFGVPTSQGLYRVLTVALCCFMTASGGPSNSKRPFLMRPTCRNNRRGNNCYLWVIFFVLKQHFWLNVDIFFPFFDCRQTHTHLAHSSLIYSTNLHLRFMDFTYKEDYWWNNDLTHEMTGFKH